MSLRRFVAFNRRLVAKLGDSYPSVFLSTHNYRRELVGAIRADIARRPQPIVLECGGIDRPLLPKSPDYEYVGLDIEHRPNCDDVYDRFVVQSVEWPLPTDADLIISFTLLEHVRDNGAAARSMFGALKAGGSTHHYVPSKWHPYSVALRAVGPERQKRLIAILRPAAVEETGYPTFFNHCSPSDMRRLFADAGFINVKTTAFYRANDYFAFFVPAYVVVSLFENVCRALNLQLFCSGFTLSAERPPA